MKKSLVLALVMAMGFSAASFAEVSDIKISGSLLTQAVNADVDLGGPGSGEKGNAVAAATSLKFEADLTEDVVAVVELFNERVWGTDNRGNGATSSHDMVQLSKAYVEFSEFMGMPAKLTVGRQQMKIGSGLIMRSGSEFSYFDNDNFLELLSKESATDGIRLQYDVSDALMVDAFYQVYDENVATERDDINYFGVDVSYELNDDIDLGAYAIYKKDEWANGNVDDVTAELTGTYGARVMAAMGDSLDLKAEYAFQNGNVSGGRRKAYILDLGATYKLNDDANTKVGLQYMLASGDKTGTADQEGYTKFRGGLAISKIATAFTNESSNVQVFGLTACRDIREDISMDLSYQYLRQARASMATSYTDGDTQATYEVDGRNRELGQAIDLTIKYDYTEDVQFGLYNGFFMPSQYFGNKNNQKAYMTNAYVKVDF